MSKFFALILLAWLLSIMFFNNCALAQFKAGDFVGSSGLAETGGGSGHKSDARLTQSPQELVALVVRSFLSVLGVVFLALMMYGGYTWMIAKGNQQRVDKAKSIIINSIIGLAIVISAYGISTYISNILKEKVVVPLTMFDSGVCKEKHIYGV